MKFNQLMFALSNKTEDYTYGSIAICYNNKLPMHKYLNELRHINDDYSASVLQICDQLLRGNEIKAQELVDYYAIAWRIK